MSDTVEMMSNPSSSSAAPAGTRLDAKSRAERDHGRSGKARSAQLRKEKNAFYFSVATLLVALVAAAAKLPKIAIAPPESKSVIGRNTESQMHIGVFWGYVAMMEGLVARMRAEIGRPARVVSTGGLAVLFNDNSDIFDAIAPDLTIQGLALLHERSLKTE